MKNNALKTILYLIGIIIVMALIVFVIYGAYQSRHYKAQNPIATMEVQDYGTVKIELYPDEAPNTVANFIKLANNGAYDGLTFHRTIPEFMIQGGDKKGDGTGTPSLKDLDENNEDKEYNIEGEFIANKINNKLKLEKGVIAMARADYSSLSQSLAKAGYNSAGAQFFITTTDQTSLNGLYAGFGKVIEGQDVVDKIANVEVYYRESELDDGEEAPQDDDGETINSDTPKEKPIITSIRVETFGIDYGMPKTQDPFNYTNWMMQNGYYGN